MKNQCSIGFSIPKSSLASAFYNGVITLNDLKSMAEDSRGKILGVLLPFMAHEYGPYFVRNLWQQSGCKWEQFDTNVDQFLERNVSLAI